MLTEKEINVLKLKKQNLTQNSIAKKLNITQPAVSKFYKNALNKIKQAQEILNINAEIQKSKSGKLRRSPIKLRKDKL
jgi:transcriptional regulator